ncbi:MAG: SAM-dependent methyltransferase [Paracoccaceae bacterium]
MSGRLILSGTGIGGPGRMTLETHQCLQQAVRVFHLTHLHEHLSNTYPGEIVDLSPIYHGAASKPAAYQTITETLIMAVKEALPETLIVFLTYGHPLFLVDSSQDMLAQIQAEVLPALSSFDTLLIDSPVHLGDGAQLFETTKFVALNQCPDAYEPLVLFQFGDYATWDNDGAPHQSRLDLLRRQLLRHFPSDHPLYVVVSAWHDDVSVRVETLPLLALASRPDVVIPGATLLLPPAKRFT